MPPIVALILVALAGSVGTVGFGIAYVRMRNRALRAEAMLAAQSQSRPANDLLQAIDAVAIEVERLGEGQRYLTRVMNEQNGGGSSGRQSER